MKQQQTLLSKDSKNFYITFSHIKDTLDEKKLYHINGRLGCPKKVRFKFENKQEAEVKYEEVVTEFIKEGWQDHTPSFNI